MKNLITPLLIIAFAIILRLVPHPPNIAPIAAMALFGGAYLNKRYALLIPLIALFLSDIFIGFHDTMPFVYGSFLLTGLIGMWLKQHRTIGNIVGATLISSALFFLLTNFGVWLMGSLYPQTFQGLIDAYFYAIPFFRNTIIGDLFYVALFFGGYELILRFIKTVEDRNTTFYFL